MTIGLGHQNQAIHNRHPLDLRWTGLVQHRTGRNRDPTKLATGPTLAAS